MTTVIAVDWKVGDNGLSRWDSNCYHLINDYDYMIYTTDVEHCSEFCIANSACIYFSYGEDNGLSDGDGKCYMYYHPNGIPNVYSQQALEWICGYIIDRIGNVTDKPISS